MNATTFEDDDEDEDDTAREGVPLAIHPKQIAPSIFMGGQWI
jgi:hypothetical protein